MTKIHEFMSFLKIPFFEFYGVLERSKLMNLGLKNLKKGLNSQIWAFLKIPNFQIFQNLKFENYNFYLENHDRSRTLKNYKS